MTLPTSSYLSLLVLLLAIVSNCSCFFDTKYVLLRHIPHPWVFDFDEDTEDFRHTLRQPWIAVDQHRITKTLASTAGFRIASAILEKQRRLTSLLVVEEIYKERNGTKFYIPNCDGVTIYIRQLENETEILEHDPMIIDDLRSGGRHVVKRLVKKVNRFSGGANVSVSHPFMYSDEEGAVVVHGARGGFGSLECQIDKLSLYGPRPYFGENGETGVRSHGADGFEYVEFSPTKEEEGKINKCGMKIEIVIVANIVPTQSSSDKWDRMNLVFGEQATARFKRMEMPYGMTLLYALHF